MPAAVSPAARGSAGHGVVQAGKGRSGRIATFPATARNRAAMPDSASPRPHSLQGVAYLMAAFLLFALLDTCAKYLTRHYPVPGDRKSTRLNSSH